MLPLEHNPLSPTKTSKISYLTLHGMLPYQHKGFTLILPEMSPLLSKHITALCQYAQKRDTANLNELVINGRHWSKIPGGGVTCWETCPDVCVEK